MDQGVRSDQGSKGVSDDSHENFLLHFDQIHGGRYLEVNWLSFHPTRHVQAGQKPQRYSLPQEEDLQNPSFGRGCLPNRASVELPGHCSPGCDSQIRRLQMGSENCFRALRSPGQSDFNSYLDGLKKA